MQIDISKSLALRIQDLLEGFLCVAFRSELDLELEWLDFDLELELELDLLSSSESEWESE